MARICPFVPLTVTPSVPFDPDVVTRPFVLRLESVAILCDEFTLNAPPVYESPVPAVVVAPDETTPPYTASDPFESAGRLRAPENVDDAVEKRPLNPMTVPVALYPTFEVNGNDDLELSVV
jgi:hypothetical protein